MLRDVRYINVEGNHTKESIFIAFSVSLSNVENFPHNLSISFSMI